MKKIAILSIIAVFVMGFTSAALAQGNVSGTYWMPGTWTYEDIGGKISVPGKGLALSGDFAFSDKFGVAFAYTSLSSTGNLIDADGQEIVDSKASASCTVIDATYKLYSDPAFAMYPSVGYLMSSSTFEAAGKATIDASGIKVGAKGTAFLMEGLEGYISGGYIPSLTVKVSDGSTTTEAQGTGMEFSGGVRYAVRVVPNLSVDAGYRYLSFSSDSEKLGKPKAITGGFFIGASYKF
ncbi:MAG TPA: porin family protein [Firmicutes bacterium]|nr:porin family protein [Bacillota bacterium]